MFRKKKYNVNKYIVIIIMMSLFKLIILFAFRKADICEITCFQLLHYEKMYQFYGNYS